MQARYYAGTTQKKSSRRFSLCTTTGTPNNWTCSPNSPTMKVLPHNSYGLWLKGGATLGNILRTVRTEERNPDLG